jgi:hypothetical protein
MDLVDRCRRVEANANPITEGYDYAGARPAHALGKVPCNEVDVVSRQQDHETNRITICNYDEYQLGGAADRTEDKAETEPPANQQRTKEEELNNLRTKNSIGAEPKSRKKAARPMPDIFPASDAMRAYAEKRGYKFEIPPCFAFNKARPGPAQAMFEAFKNHHGAKGSQFADWDAAWRTWVDNQAKWDTERGKPPGLRPAI